MNLIKRKLFIFSLIFLSLLVIPIVSAAAPVLSTVQAGSLEILVPSWDNIAQGQDVNFYWHVFNTTAYLNNVTANCTFHLYSIAQNGEHIVSIKSVAGFSNDRDFEVFVDGANFTNLGEYRYVIECFTPNSGKFGVGQTGGLVDEFIVNKTGAREEVYPTTLLLLILCAILILLGIYFEVYPLALLGGLAAMPISLHVITNGINNIINNVTTVFGIVCLGTAMYLTVKAGIHLIQEGLNG